MLLEPIPREIEDKVLMDMGYSREQLDKDLEELKEWLQYQLHLPSSRLRESDSFLKMFLTGCKGDMDKVKNKLDSYYTFRGVSELYESRDPLAPEYVAIKSLVCFCAVPNIDEKQMTRVVLFHLADPDLNKFNLLSYSRKLMSLGEMRLRIDSICVRDAIIIDCAGCTIKHALKLKPLLVRDMVRLAQEILPFRYFKVFVINAPSFVDVTLNNLIKPFLSKKLQQRIIITSGGHEVLYEYLDENNLPKDYGGKNPPLQELAERWHKKESELRDWFVNDLSERTDESKRANNCKAIKNKFLGINFKKLVID